MLRVSLFGHFEITLHGQPIGTINTPRLQSLLAYLLLHCNEAISRGQLAALFWPDLKAYGNHDKPQWVKIMATRRHKTLVVCQKCHQSIHSGNYIGPRLSK